MPVWFSEKNLGQLGKTGSGEGTPGSTYPLNMVGDRDCDQYQLEELALTRNTVKGERNKLMSKSLRFAWAYYYTDICFSMRDDGQQKIGSKINKLKIWA